MSAVGTSDIPLAPGPHPVRGTGSALCVWFEFGSGEGRAYAFAVIKEVLFDCLLHGHLVPDAWDVKATEVPRDACAGASFLYWAKPALGAS